MPVSSHELASFAVGYPVPLGAVKAAGPTVIDTLAVMIAGSIEPVMDRLMAALRPEAGAGGFPAIGRNTRYRADDAALLYGTASHALDYDDVSMLAICHPSAPILTALLASAPWEEIDGGHLLEAHAIGTEAMVRMGQAMGLRHYEIGYHSTATLGLFGAVAAIARLRRLDAETTHSALAIAASLTGGMRVNFGTDVKPLHVGLAATHAIQATDWAAAGVTASKADLFAPTGILATLSARPTWTWPDEVRLGNPFAIEEPGFEVKRFPGCYLLHKVMALGLKIAENGIKLTDIAKIEMDMARGGTRPLIYPSPVTGREAQFSIPYAMLAAIADGEVTFATFTDEAVNRPVIRARLADVSAVESGPDLETSEAIGAAPVRAIVRLNDGSSRTFERTAAPGSAQDPITSAQSRAKWIDCLRRANPSLSADSAAEAYDRAGASLGFTRLSEWLPDLWRLTVPAGN